MSPVPLLIILGLLVFLNPLLDLKQKIYPKKSYPSKRLPLGNIEDDCEAEHIYREEHDEEY